jgi:hypothetical protein
MTYIRPPLVFSNGPYLMYVCVAVNLTFLSLSLCVCLGLVTLYCSLVRCNTYFFLLSWHPFLQSMFPLFFLRHC